MTPGQYCPGITESIPHTQRGGDRPHEPDLQHERRVPQAPFVQLRYHHSLGRQLNRLEKEFVAKGGIKEKMFQARVEARTPVDTPECPQCDKPMQKRSSNRGEFWGCSGYPECKGTRQIEEA